MIKNTEKGICFLCGKYAPTDLHHCLGGSNRKQCDKDGLTVYLCRDCHTGKYGVHGSKGGEAMKYLHELAQREYEANLEATGLTKEETREQFIKNYIRSYL